MSDLPIAKLVDEWGCDYSVKLHEHSPLCRRCRLAAALEAARDAARQSSYTILASFTNKDDSPPAVDLAIVRDKILGTPNSKRS